MTMGQTEGSAGFASGWLATLGSDVTKITLGLYLIGTLVSIVYYSRFSILSLDFIKAQAILVGCYVIATYLAVPVVTLWVMRRMTNNRLITGAFLAVLASSDTLILLEAGSRKLAFALGLFTMMLLQFCCFVEVGKPDLPIRKARSGTRFHLVPSKSRSAGLVVLFCVHFALTIFPGIPMYVGGSRPLPVQIFTKTTSLPEITVAPYTKNRNFNPSIDSYGLQLLYETDKEMYFLTDVTASGAVIMHLVTRIPRSEIVRVDYQTPKWVTWR
jgi:hypothetical protein